MQSRIGRGMTAMWLVMLLMEPAGASAQAFSGDKSTLSNPERIATVSPSAPEVASVRDWNWNGQPNVQSRATNQIIRSRRPTARQPRPRSKAYRDAQRVLAGAALGIVGGLAGGTISLGIAENCHCGGNGTIWTGMAVGAAAGATAGVLLVR